ncbi:MAG: hypothetical protein WDM76_02010 [Limisphaerales bacterium]
MAPPRPQNDATETAAINRWAGENVKKLLVSSTKSSIGHLLGAAGAVEAVVCLMALRGQWLPPQLSTETLDSTCRFQIVRQPTDAKMDVALSNSFALAEQMRRSFLGGGREPNFYSRTRRGFAGRLGRQCVA